MAVGKRKMRMNSTSSGTFIGLEPLESRQFLSVTTSTVPQPVTGTVGSARHKHHTHHLRTAHVAHVNHRQALHHHHHMHHKHVFHRKHIQHRKNTATPLILDAQMRNSWPELRKSYHGRLPWQK